MGHMNWLDYLDTLDERGLAPLTKLAQRWIYEKQHPPKSDCKNRKFYVSEGTERLGLGAYLHKQGWGLAAALEANLIFVMNPVGTHEGVYDFADNCGTGSHNLTSLECFTQPLSSCTVEHAVVGKNAQLFREADWVGVDLDGSGVSFHKDSPPSYLKNKLAEHYSGVKLTSAFYKVWWRGQSAAYLSRLNAAMSDDIRKARKDVEVHRTWSHGTGGLPSNGIPYPMPAGTMNIHVRHGDKGSEMTLIPFETYVASAERYSSENPQTAFKRVFVSSEDPGVIDDAAKLPERNRRTLTAPDEQWQVFTSVIPRVNAGPYQQIHQYGSTVMTKSWYLQLWMALECDAYFGTRASNWNRIIDEFRCIYVDKCQLPYFEMGPENDWKDYYW
ncbi:hypothetical protein PhCBS80983_g01956 [Powellomyces hirtus]|uniref:Uncharacterized protein n=1 Tax=Powellomyces hirtus TaxID=109895 RepID=A0A507E8X3_9FUNG|nr:hypothetical protein PhCBS80983_g01956 [Powellomyces hirtus]